MATLNGPVPHPAHARAGCRAFRTVRSAALLSAVWLIWNTLPARAVDCSRNATQVELTRCAGEDATRADAELHKAYRALMAKIDAAGQARLRTAQRAWISFRDAECTFETGGGANQSGTIWPMLVDECLAKVTRVRTRDLREQLKCPGWDLACPGG